MASTNSEMTATSASFKQALIESAVPVSGKHVALRLWANEKPQNKQSTKNSYETVGYVISGRAELALDGQTITLRRGDSWLVPADANHAYSILETFTAIEAISAPALNR